MIVDTNSSDPDVLLSGLVGQIQGDMVSQLSSLKNIHLDTSSILEYEVERLTNDFGKNDPTVQQLISTINQNANIINHLEAKIQLAQITIPVFAEGQALIHGRVADESSIGIDGLAISMIDTSGKTLAYTVTTDANGYFSVTIDPALSATLSQGAGIFLVVRTGETDVQVYRQTEPQKIIIGNNVINISINKSQIDALGKKYVGNYKSVIFIPKVIKPIKLA